MKFLKKSQINFRNVKDNSVAVQIDGEITLDSTNVLLIPTGTTSQRPTTPKNGHIRYNVELEEFEFFENNQWKQLGSNEPQSITQQDLGAGDGIEIYFGPLNPVPDLATPQNILVFIENLIQLSTINYVLEDNPVGKTEGRYIKFSEAVPPSLSVTVLHGFDR